MRKLVTVTNEKGTDIHDYIFLDINCIVVGCVWDVN